MTTSLTLTQGLPNGKGQQVLRKLQEQGVSVNDYVAIGTNDALLVDICTAIFKHRMFTQPDEQARRMIEIGTRLWRDSEITNEAIEALGDPPECPISDKNGLYCVTLLFETGDPLKTFERNWAATVYVHGESATWKWDGLRFVTNDVRPRGGAKSRKQGFRWAVCELGRSYKGQRVCNARIDLDSKETMGIGQELPLIATMHPIWARAMDGDNIPFVDAPDLEVAPNGEGEFNCAPCLDFSRGRGQVGLSAHGVGDDNSCCGSGFLR